MSEATEAFWRGQFGDEYNDRNKGALARRNIAFFARALAKAGRPIETVLEMGCGTGQNFPALRRLLGDVRLEGVEINSQAATEAAANADFIFNQSISEWEPPTAKDWDLVITKGFLIHVPPEDLVPVYEKIYHAARHLILIAEYYNPAPVEVPYRGNAGKLWKRDFATEIIARFPTLRVADYGFVWRHDYPWQQDDITYFLLEKR